jgi:gliding motility-associated-like protein
VDDMENTRILEFPPGSTSATNGVTVAGGYGQGTAPNQFEGSYGFFVDGKGNIYISDLINSRVQELTTFRSIDTLYVPSAPGSYTAVVTDQSGCTETTNAIVISAPPTPAITIAANKTAECAGAPVVFTASTVNGGASPSYQWQVNGNNTGTSSDTLISSSLLNGDMVSCVLTSSIACTTLVSSADPIVMTVYPLPVVDFNPDTLIIKGGGSTLLSLVIGGTNATYQWTPATGLDNPDLMTPLANPVSTTTYQLTVTDNNGCQASGKETVLVYYPFEMPNAFTPNGDGKNDVFRIPFSKSQNIKVFAVYDRWGMRVFETANSSVGWDGTFAGQPQPAGTYVWQIEYEDLLTARPTVASGTVILIR